MTYLEFLSEIGSNPGTYTVCLLLLLGCYLVILCKKIHSIFDPLFIAITYAAFAAAAVLFLWCRKAIDLSYTMAFACTEAAFVAGLLCFRSRSPKLASPKTRLERQSFLSALYLVSVVVFLVSQVTVYLVQGIPILYDSRLKYYATGGGIGIFDRVISITSFLSWYLLIRRMSYKIKIGMWPKLFDWLVLVALIASAVLSGSKSTFLSVVFLLFYFRLLNRFTEEYTVLLEKKIAAWQRRLVTAACFAALGVITYQVHSETYFSVLLQAYERLASFGDTFFMAFPTHLVDHLSSQHSFLAIFGGLLVMLRVVDPSSLPENLGFQLYRGVYGFDAFVGPNPRHNLFGMVYFGFIGAVVYSFILGLLIAYIRNRLIHHVRVGTVGEPIYVFFAVSCVWATTDIALVVKDLSSAILVLPVLVGMSTLLNLALKSGRTHAVLVLEGV